MPYSSDEGKAWIRGIVTRTAPDSFLDVGVGCGTYSDLLRHGSGARFTGIEVFEPYVERFRLREKYDDLLVADAVLLEEFPTADVVILGDVLEHMRHADALVVWDKALRAARLFVVLSLPVVEWPQGESEGNAREAHLHTWSREAVVSELRGVESWRVFGPIGVFLAKGEAS